MHIAYQHAPSHLVENCARLLPRLRLIPEFRPWLRSTGWNRNTERPFRVLLDCFQLGAPLCTLLDLLGAPSSGNLNLTNEDFDCDNAVPARESFFVSFIHRVQMLEFQRRLSYGEVLRPDDLLSGGMSGFARVLRTVKRVLDALEDSHPGLYVLPNRSEFTRRELVQELLESERVHVSALTKLEVINLWKDIPAVDAILECLAIHRSRILWYHQHILRCLEEAVLYPMEESWQEIFAFDDNALHSKALAAYSSYCANYLTLTSILQEHVQSSELASVQSFLGTLAIPLHRLGDISRFLQAILDVSLPSGSYDSLCTSLLNMNNISESINDGSRQIRTMYSTQILKGRAYVWSNTVDPGDLGILLLDDYLAVDSSGLQYCVFLFEAMLLCCREHCEEEPLDSTFGYPIAPWELGPALRRGTPLDLVYAIETSSLKSIRCSADFFEIDWAGEHGTHTLVFRPTASGQYDQWCMILEAYVQSMQKISNVSSTRHLEDDDTESLLSEDVDAGGRHRSHARPWSVIARKGPGSDSSSLLNQESQIYDPEFPLSPGLLPTLFQHDLPRSPLSIKTQFVSSNTDAINTSLTTQPVLLNGMTGDDLDLLPDLTGQITREGTYPSAHGGYADIWKGLWYRESDDCTVAIKVLRSQTSDPEIEEKITKRLRRELRVWSKLDHVHILPLYGVASDFGPYMSMICPWMDNGSVTGYLERCSDILSITDRLQLLCEVADGLSYLHSFSIVHGDLTGSNILITDSGKACLCDFGLSSIIAEFQGDSLYTSSIGGSVRWADSRLFRMQETGNYDNVPVVTMQSDIYSFGSVMLEILSGRIPYHYVRTDAQVIIEVHRGVKPRRPAVSFVADTHWAFMQRCWKDDLLDRPGIEEVCKRLQEFWSSAKAGELRRWSA